MVINNRDLPDESAGLYLNGESSHKIILHLAKTFVNDIHQAGNVPIVLDDLSDKKI
jgi:hypothetical protein